MSLHGWKFPLFTIHSCVSVVDETKLKENTSSITLQQNYRLHKCIKMGRRRKKSVPCQKHQEGNQNCEYNGFYYDPNTNRHFRVPQGPWNAHLPSFQQPKTLVKKSYQPKSNCLGVPKLFFDRSIGAISRKSYEKSYSKTRILSMVPVCQQYVRTGSSDHHTQIDFDRCSFLVSHPNISAAIAVMPVNHVQCTRLFALHVEPDTLAPKEVSSSSVKVRTTANCVAVVDRVMDICVAECFKNDFWVLACLVGSFTKPSYAYMWDVLSRPESEEIKPPLCELKFKGCATYSCDWNRTTWKGVFGQDRRAVVSDLENRLEPLFTAGQTVLATRFSQDGRLVFAGLRNGHLQCTDLRDKPGSKYAYIVNMAKPVSDIHVLRDCDDVVVSGYRGLLANVDLRWRKQRVSFDGHVNDNLKIHCSVDEVAEILCSGGQDGNTRFWDLATGKLFHTVRPQRHLGSDDIIPAVYYRSSWISGPSKYNSSALLSVVKDQLVVHQTC